MKTKIVLTLFILFSYGCSSLGAKPCTGERFLLNDDPIGVFK